MQWLPRWLGKSYGRLYLSLGGRSFSNSEARAVLDVDDLRLNFALSRLASAGWLLRLARGRYLTVEPPVVFSALENDWSSRFRGRGFIPCLETALGEAFKVYGGRLAASALFGSCARGDERKESDVDLLLVADGLSDKYSERLHELVMLRRACSEVITIQWEESGEFHLPDIVALTPQELLRNELFLLDLTRDAVILYDRAGVLRKRLTQLSEWLKRTRSRRVETPSGQWYWELGPQALAEVDRTRV